ncbi:ral guanine nucleotide dissociation stimulator-like [Mesocricetus auratus]|uniref:Ral guanine nucleotide dissociation stimulator-like n=1 Tax=Mesocricetus auratus TaxID=10036 RepID=A0ABM2WQJ5_MESAU|nr:ral guanine nucleotide dissociation stimulator-like [Mesocricetus auratus]
MFSCCLGNTRKGISDLKEDKRGGSGGGHGGAWSLRACSWIQGLWPFGLKETNLTQGGQRSRGSQGTQESQGIQVQDVTVQVREESAPKMLEESRRPSQFGSMEEMMAQLVTSIQGGDSFFVFVFYCIHQKFLTTQHVLDLLFKRYPSFRPDSEEDERIKYTICTLLDYWIDKFPEDFCTIQHLPILNQVKTYLIVNMPSSDLLVRVKMLQMQLEA